MLSVLGLLTGAGVGWLRATKRGGNTLDKAQYAAGFGIAGGLLGVIAGIILTYLLRS